MGRKVEAAKAVAEVERRREKMTNLEKITVRGNWDITNNKRVGICNATYRQALSYLVNLRVRWSVPDCLKKPVRA